MTDIKQNLIGELRKKLGNTKENFEKRQFLKCETILEGVPRGVICEIVGPARTEWILNLLKQNPSLFIFWAEEKLTILPTAIHQRGVDLKQILIAETGNKLFQSLRKALKSKLFDCIILPGTIEEVKMLKALQLFARESNSFIFFLSKNPKNAWAIPFQLEARWLPNSKNFSIKILKFKFSQVVLR